MSLRVGLAIAGFALAAPAGLAWPGRPTSPAPPAPNPGAPPPAWAETSAESTWLAYGSYCWKTTCVDMIPPGNRPDLPSIVVIRGATIRLHLGFRATSVTVSVDKAQQQPKLDAGRTVVSWKATRRGLLTVSARAASGASYVARIRFR